jgi:F-type H+-transporting ATPase subunit delta
MTDSMINTVDVVYATALVEMAEEKGQLNDVAQELAELGELFASNDNLNTLLGNQVLSLEDRAALVERLFKGQVSDLLYRFVQVISRKNRLGELAGIIRGFHQLFAEKQGIIEADVYVANKLDDAKLSSIADSIGSAIGKKIVPHQHEDASLIGGIKLRIGDKLIDGSVVTQLKLMQQNIIEQGQDNASAAIGE